MDKQTDGQTDGHTHRTTTVTLAAHARRGLITLSIPIPADFIVWKEDFEKHTNSWFVQGTGEKDLLGGGITYYYCNRSGHFKSKGTGQRHVKTQGTSKINSHCTAVYRE